MTSQNVAFMSMVLDNKLDDPTKLFALKQCENLDDSAVSSLSAIKLKSPVMGLVLHCFLGLFPRRPRRRPADAGAPLLGACHGSLWRSDQPEGCCLPHL